MDFNDDKCVLHFQSDVDDMMDDVQKNNDCVASIGNNISLYLTLCTICILTTIAVHQSLTRLTY